ncbi:MAG: hypothetical protein ACO1NM_07360, partial [Sphingobium phenoxybenzoativorans]
TAARALLRTEVKILGSGAGVVGVLSPVYRHQRTEISVWHGCLRPDRRQCAAGASAVRNGAFGEGRDGDGGTEL